MVDIRPARPEDAAAIFPLCSLVEATASTSASRVRTGMPVPPLDQ